MRSRTREALGWGAVGAPAFLVLALGYQLLTEAAIDLPVLLGVALVVFLAAAGATYLARSRVE